MLLIIGVTCLVTRDLGTGMKRGLYTDCAVLTSLAEFGTRGSETGAEAGAR